MVRIASAFRIGDRWLTEVRYPTYLGKRLSVSCITSALALGFSALWIHSNLGRSFYQSSVRQQPSRQNEFLLLYPPSIPAEPSSSLVLRLLFPLASVLPVRLLLSSFSPPPLLLLLLPTRSVCDNDDEGDAARVVAVIGCCNTCAIAIPFLSFLSFPDDDASTFKSMAISSLLFAWPPPPRL